MSTLDILRKEAKRQLKALRANDHATRERPRRLTLAYGLKSGDGLPYREAP